MSRHTTLGPIVRSNLLRTCYWVCLVAAATASAETSSDFEVRPDLEYASHDGVRLSGDYYVPKKPGRYPMVIAMHGGGWQLGSKADLQNWGEYLAGNGIACFSIDYRLSKPGQQNYPKPVLDVRAAIQFVRSRTDELKIDPERIGLIGNSAGAHLAALIALAGNESPFSGQYRTDAYSGVSAKVKAVVGIYGTSELIEHWRHELVARPGDQSLEKLLGTTPIENRKIYLEASPINYAIRANNQISFFLSWGTGDDMVSPSQSEQFRDALKQAGFYVRTAPVAAAPHFWMGMPINEAGSPTGFVAPQVLRFLRERL